MFFFKQKTAYEMRISDWSSDVCSSDLVAAAAARHQFRQFRRTQRLVGNGGRLPGDPRHRMGRAAGGDRQLPPPLFLSRLLEAARRSEWQGVEELGARQIGRAHV